MESYYVTAAVTRPMGAESMKEICVAGRIYVGRVKAIVQAVSPADAIAAGTEKIAKALDGSGLHASDYGCMSVYWAEKLGDSEIYGRYPTADMIRM